MGKTVIGIAGNILIMDGGMFPGIERDYVNRDYTQSVCLAGAVPVILAVQTDEEAIRAQIERVDGVILSGGYDINTLLYGENPIREQGFVYPKVDEYYLMVIKISRELGKPVFGICKGIQAVNVAFGGSLYQDLGKQMPESMKHSQSSPREYGTHQVHIERDSFLGECLPETVLVNSFHHQAVKQLAEGFRVTAKADDGVVEGIECTNGSFIAAVQWHPEMMASHGNETMKRLFEHFVEKISDMKQEG